VDLVFPENSNPVQIRKCSRNAIPIPIDFETRSVPISDFYQRPEMGTEPKPNLKRSRNPATVSVLKFLAKSIGKTRKAMLNKFQFKSEVFTLSRRIWFNLCCKQQKWLESEKLTPKPDLAPKTKTPNPDPIRLASKF